MTSLADDLEDTVKGIQDFIKSLAKAQKDLKGVDVSAEEVKTVSSSSTQIAAPAGGGVAKTKAASTLFSLLSGDGAPAAGAPGAPATAAAAGPPSAGGPPKAPAAGGGGPPKRPPSGGGGPPKAPAAGGGPPKRGNLPPAPKLPPAPSGGGGAPAAPTAGTVKTPSFAKRAPAPPGTGAPPPAPTPPDGAAPAAAKAGGGLSSLRDEMLEELTRLKKIMRGD